MIDPVRWQRLKDLFQQALAQEGAARNELVRAACAADAEMERELLSLLEAHEQASHFMAAPALGGGLRLEAPAEPAEAFKLGAYRVLSVIGEGGMGTVCRAVRADDAYEKQVAVKLVRRGFDSTTRRSRRTSSAPG